MSPRRARGNRPAQAVERRVVTGTVQAIVAGGKALLRDEDGVLFARGGLVGELVDVVIERRSGGTRHGVVVQVHEPSPERTRPDCGLHPRCGGCDLLDLSPAAQTAAKAGIVRDALSRIARLDDAALACITPVVSPPDGRGLRRRARVVIDDDGRPGFFGRDSHRMVAVERCPALAPRLEEALRGLALHRVVPPGAWVQIACDDDDKLSAALPSDCAREARMLVERGVVHGALLVDDRDRVVQELGAPVLRGEIAPGVDGGPYASDAATFTQATRFGGRAILDEVVHGAGALSGTRVLELFAGAGHLTLPLLRGGAHVVAVEGAGRSVHWLRENTRGLDVDVRAAFIDASLPLEGPYDVLVIDPPRTGVVGLEGLLPRANADRLVLVSCDPATGARDLQKAVQAGYVLERLVPIDAFPRTSHVEWVASLRRA